jgi:hypothetical protein
MNTNCERCDRPECERDSRKAAMLAHDAPGDSLRAFADAAAICAVYTVNWRDRCLAAEAELAKLREGLPRWKADEFRPTDLVLRSYGGEAGRAWFWAGHFWSRCGGVVTQHVDMDAARRMVETHHGLPVCEVLP